MTTLENLGARARARAARDGEAEEREPTSWLPVDLTAALSGVDVEPPTVFARSDQFRLLYRGRVHAFQGESESLKSWAAQFAASQVLAEGNNVLYIDFEDDERGVASRLLALGVEPPDIAKHFIYLRPDEPLRTRHDEATPASSDLLDILESPQLLLAVIDGVTEAMTTEGLDLVSNTDVATWMRRLPRLIAKTGAAVVVVDHLAKDRSNRGRYALGGQHKLAGLTGAAFKFALTKALCRATGTEAVEGRAVITVEKDRPGYLRGRSVDDRIGELLLTSSPDGGVTASVEPPTQGGTTDRRVVTRILEYLSSYNGSSKNAIETGVEGKAAVIRGALSWMAEIEWVRVERKGNGHLHWLTEAGMAQLSSPGTRDEAREGIS